MHLSVSPRFAVLLAGGVLAACSQPAAVDSRTQTPLVQIVTVRSDGTSYQRFTGVIAARIQSDLGFRVGGKVIERLVDTGQHVRRGDPLMRLDPNDLSLGVTAQQGAVEAARARSVKADADLARMDGLVQQGAVSAQDYDLAVEAARSAKAQLNAAVAQTDIAKNADQYAVLRADADGVVVSRIVDAGQVVAAGQTVVVLAKDGPREAAITLPETVRPELTSEALAAIYGDNGVTYPARLRELSHAADPLTRTFAARYVLSGAAAEAPLGATVTIRLDQKDRERETVVPIGALYDRGQGPGVWLLDKDNRIAYRAVKVTRVGDEAVTVSSGLSAGDRVVALGAHQLHDNEEVRIATLQGEAQ